VRNWSIPIGKLFGVEVRVHFTFVFLLAFIWMAESSMPKSTGQNSTPGRVLGLVGIIFGTLPANRAAQMDPVESLKYE